MPDQTRTRTASWSSPVAVVVAIDLVVVGAVEGGGAAAVVAVGRVEFERKWAAGEDGARAGRVKGAEGEAEEPRAPDVHTAFATKPAPTSVPSFYLLRTAQTQVKDRALLGS